ncbi:hypothetical protein [Campylobacter sp. P0085]|uniref:hypothetical protein n=1 Tax=Campylobacter sp. P0085 TaxID=1895597 RepID=UPI0015C4E9E1|nr:hypothetical protein [Campylobacter sp. P0085]
MEPAALDAAKLWMRSRLSTSHPLMHLINSLKFTSHTTQIQTNLINLHPQSNIKFQ